MEILFYNSVLNSTQQKQIEGYLAYKWGIQGSLPATHPFYRNPYFAEAIYYPQAIIKTTGTNLKHPVAIAGLSLWFDALDVYGTGQSVPIGSVVTQWIDKSPFSNSTSSYSGSPIYSGAAINANPAIYFKSSNSPPPMYYLGSLSQTFSGRQMNCFAVANLGSNIGAASNSYSAYGRILGLARTGADDFADPSTTFPFIQNNATLAMIIGRQSSYLSTPIPSYNTAFLVQSSQNSNMEYIGVNGNLTPASQNTGISSAFNISAYGIGTNPNTTDTGSYWTGYIGEVIAFLGITLTTPQVQSVEGYLAWKWGLQGSLASGHPYQNNFTSPPYRNPIVRNNYTTRFNPTSIGGSRAWFDAYDASYTTSGNTVTGWTNKSGNANATTGSGTVSINQVTLNGKSSVRFAAGTNYLNVTLSYTTPLRSLFYVMTAGAATPGAISYIALNANDTIGGQSYQYNGWIELDKSGTVGLQTQTPTNFFNATSIVSLCTTTGNTGIWINGISQTLTYNNITPTFWSTGSSSLTIGGQSGTSGTLTDLYEIIQYDGPITTAQRQQVEGYLAWKWGLPKSLPTTHPYYNFPPSP